MSEITTGPELEACGWYVRTKRTDVDAAGWLVADCSTSPHGKEYARLFAAAPKMLDLLIKARRYVGMVTDLAGEDPIFDVMDEIDAVIVAATTALEAAPEPVRVVTIAGVDR
ncbi:hypothetical protein SY91_01743 [Burkholderia cenocepacia]|uniref:hypothetical protein n=1 Tax=Burkholderia cenocepacia TaxID=95486 RepID=UPI00163C4AEE|nr:hypothetical protein [Burkholderia cenocepacia]QND94344.1 hypothetical protein SY91_01743 [Burkholderia cenocepacia]